MKGTVSSHGERHFRIRGMDCAEEVSVLKDALRGIPGIIELRFDVIKAKMTVSCTSSCNSDAVLSAVDSTGMKAIPWQDWHNQPDASFWERQGRVIMTVLSGSSILIGFVIHWLMHGGLTHALGSDDGQSLPVNVVFFYSLAAITGAWFIAPKALSAARRFRPDMNLLMTIAAIGAVLIDEWFEAAAVTFLFSLSLVLESWSVGRARRAISALLDLTPTTARYMDPLKHEVIEKTIDKVPQGVTVLVRPGEKVPLDGVVTKGQTTVNQAPITGESRPVPKQAGDDVFAGTINGDGAFEVRSTTSADDTTLARIVHMVEEAQSRRSGSERWVDSFARYYTPIVLLMAVFLAFVPPLVGAGLWSTWIYQALVVLVIACPCALVISTPVSIVSGLSSAAKAGVLIKGGLFLEAPSKLKALALDKTGTLTYGDPRVNDIEAFGDHTAEVILSHAAALEAESGHPIARAIYREATRQSLKMPSASGIRDIKGRGTEGFIGGRSYWIGSHRFMHEKGAELPEMHESAIRMEEGAHSLVAVGTDTHVCGLISVSDRVRNIAPSTVEAIRKAGVSQIVMLTGDNQSTAKAVAIETGVTSFKAELLPEDKVAAIEELVSEYGHVAMIGDGVNDAPAMAVSSLGIAMGATGTDAAIETADIALMSDDLSRIPWLIHHSKRVVRVIRQNIAISLGVKAIFLVLALFQLATLWMAIAADMGASLIVVFNGLTLLHGGSLEKKVLDGH